MGGPSEEHAYLTFSTWTTSEKLLHRWLQSSQLTNF